MMLSHSLQGIWISNSQMEYPMKYLIIDQVPGAWKKGCLLHLCMTYGGNHPPERLFVVPLHWAMNC